MFNELKGKRESNPHKSIITVSFLGFDFVDFYLDEFHEKVDVFGVEFGGEVLDGLVEILGERIWVAADGEFGPPYLLHVLSGRRHCRTS